MYLGAGSQPQASVSCRVIHSAVGCAVTPSHNIWRRPCRRISKPYNRRNEIVGTTNKSIDAMPSAWLRRKVFQPCDGGHLLLAMYFATVVCPTSMPSLSSSPCIRGAPQSGFDDTHLADQAANVRRCLRPATARSGFPAPIGSEAGAVPAHQRLRPYNLQGVQHPGSQAIEPNKQQPVDAAEG